MLCNISKFYVMFLFSKNLVKCVCFQEELMSLFLLYLRDDVHVYRLLSIYMFRNLEKKVTHVLFKTIVFSLLALSRL